jgi:uncharacterized protein
VVICFALLFLTFNYYYPVWNSWFSSLLFFFILPILVIVVVLRKNPLDFGLRWGDIRLWGKYVAIFCAVAFIVLLISAFSPELQKYYRMQNFNLGPYFSITFASLFGSEFLFRGFLIFGLKEKFQEASILIQIIPFVMVHFSKPELETFSTIITGLLLGYVAYRGKSFWPAFIIHMFINVFFVVWVNLLFT